MIRWSELKYHIGRLRSLGMCNDATEAKAQIVNDPAIAEAWLNLWECAAHAVNLVSHILRDAYAAIAATLGSERVQSIKVMETISLSNAGLT